MSTQPVDLVALTWRPDPASREVSRERLDAIAFTPMSARLRNELITRSYGDIAQAMADLLGTSDATWAAFGQWASTTIGGYLSLRIPVLGPLIGQAFGDGNRDVFADIGRAHTTFLASVGRAYIEGTDLGSAWAQCADDLQQRLLSPPGGPLDATAEGFWKDTLDPRSRPEGARYNLLLVLGFRAYYHALETPDPERKSRSILLGNCLIGLHEQRLLARAISAGFRSWLRTVTAPWRLLQPRARWMAHVPGGWQLRLESFWIHLATQHLIGVRLPWATVEIGRGVPVGERPVEVSQVPRDDAKSGHHDLRPVRSLTDDELLGEAFERFTVTGEPAVCWNDLRSRMAYIMALFAAHQRSTGWFDTDGSVTRPVLRPGLDDEIAALVSGLEQPPLDPPATAPNALTEDLDRLRTEPSFVALDVDVQDVILDQSMLTNEQRKHLYRSLSADISGRLEVLSQPGGLLDADTCRNVRSLFQRWSTMWFMGLLFRSLPDSYAAAAGVRVLGEVSTLATDPFRRAGETAQFVLDLLGRDEGWDAGVLLPDGDAYRSVIGVRAMHAVIAGRLLDEGWDQTRYGLPLNAEDVLGTALTFAVSPLEMLDCLGLDLKSGQRDDWVRFWLGIGHLLGAPYDWVTTAGEDDQRASGASARWLLGGSVSEPSRQDGRIPLDYRQARTLAHVIWARHHTRSLDGVRLGEAILAGVADGFPRWAGWLPAGLLRVLGDPRVVQLLLLGRSEGRHGGAVVAAFFRLLLAHRLTRPLGRALVRLTGHLWLRPFLRQGRSRPYRRPLRNRDRARLAWSQQVAQAWPLTCTNHEGRS